MMVVTNKKVIHNWLNVVFIGRYLEHTAIFFEVIDGAKNIEAWRVVEINTSLGDDVYHHYIAQVVLWWL